MMDIKLEFNDEGLQQLIDAMILVKPHYEAVNKGAHWRSQILSIAQVYPAEKNTIFRIFDNHPTRLYAIPTGPAPKVISKKKNKGYKDKDCEGCPGNIMDTSTSVHKQVDNPKVFRPSVLGELGDVPETQEIKKSITANKGQEPDPPAVVNEDWVEYTWEAVAFAFDEDSQAMKAFAQTKQIKMPANIKNVEKIAVYITAYLNANQEKLEV